MASQKALELASINVRPTYLGTYTTKTSGGSVQIVRDDWAYETTFKSRTGALYRVDLDGSLRKVS